jgi:hypothetical protein
MRSCDKQKHRHEGSSYLVLFAGALALSVGWGVGAFPTLLLLAIGTGLLGLDSP